MMTNDDTKRIGILNEGKNNTFINNTFSNLDIGIKNKGDNTFASNNEFLDEQSTIQSSEQKFTMNNPIIYIIVILIISGITYYFF